MIDQSDDKIRDLLKESLLEVPSPGFDDELMMRIGDLKPEKKRFFSYISGAWITAIISLVLVPLAIMVIPSLFTGLKVPWISELILNDTTVMLVMSIFFAAILLFLFDNLIRLTIKNKVVKHTETA